MTLFIHLLILLHALVNFSSFLKDDVVFKIFQAH
jgi:hypothetical protein